MIYGSKQTPVVLVTVLIVVSVKRNVKKVVITHVCNTKLILFSKKPLQIQKKMFSKVTITDQPVKLVSAAHRIFVIDCSGSMYDTIDMLRTHLKNKIPILSQPDDFISIIWFQHYSHFGVLQEHINIANMQDLQAFNNALDRYLRAGGGTYFGDAVTKANELAEKYQEGAQIFFMTDGCENSQNETTRNAFANAKASTVLVEYGWYTNREYIEELTNLSNGVSIFSKDFEKITGSFDTYLTNTVDSKQKRTVENVDYCFQIVDGECKIWKANSDRICSLPSSYSEVYTFTSENIVDETFITSDDQAYYACLMFCIKQRLTDVVWKLLQITGDKYFIRKWYSCYSKQDFVNIFDDLKDSYCDALKRFREGKDVSFMPREDEFTVMDLLKCLENDPSARMYPYHQSFKYTRISRKVESAERFVANKDLGCELHLVYNATRANVSIGCKVYGHTIKADESIEATQTYRNYAIIKDGVKHFNSLPLSFSEATFNLLKENKLVDGDFKANKVYVLPLIDIPVINRAMTKGKSFNSEDYVTKCVEKLWLMAQRKYLKSMIKEEKKEEESGATFEKGEKKESIDQYTTKELIVKIEKCSSIPTVNDKLLLKLSTNGKLTLSESLMESIHQEYTSQSDENKKVFANTKLAEISKQLIDITSYLEGIKFIILAGNLWFSNEQPYDGALTKDITYQGKNFSATINIVEKIILL